MLKQLRRPDHGVGQPQRSVACLGVGIATADAGAGVAAWAEAEDEALNALKKDSPLPRAPDRKALDQLCQELVEEAWGEGVGEVLVSRALDP